MMKYIEELSLKGKKVFIRADLNVPLNEKGEVADDTRIVAAMRSVTYALEQGAKVILASHFGRPDGKRVPSLSLKVVVKTIERLTNKSVIMAPDCIGDAVKELVGKLQPGQILLLENLRFHEEEEKNDISFAMKLAQLADVYVNDAFATAHRAHASNYGITEFFNDKAAGFTIQDELKYFNQVFEASEPPLVVIFGGSKVSTKIGAIENVARIASKILVGGAMANTFLAAKGLELGSSLVETDELENAIAIMDFLTEQNVTLVLPEDLVVAQELKAGVTTKIVPVNKVDRGWMALDIGPKTIETFQGAIAEAKTIIWNGPLGAFEVAEFSKGTFKIVEALASSPALTVVGGGDTDLALHQCNAMDKMSYVSTAGGAFLTLLEGEPLPAIEVLEQSAD